MSLYGRHLFIVQKLNESFGIWDDVVTEELVKAAPILEKIDAFFRGDGPAEIIFFYTGTPATDAVEARHEIVVGDGMNMPLAPRAVFFMKTRTAKRDEKLVSGLHII